MGQNKTERHPLVGGSSLIVIFAVLCLAVFAMLMLTTENSARRLSQVSAEAVRAYYEADTRAELTAAAIRNGDVPAHVTVEGSRCFYSEAISDTRYLHVELELREGEWVILRWQAVSTLQ